MPASTNLITDAATMITNGPSAATATKAAGTANEQDMVGHLQLYSLKLKECQQLLTQMKLATDSGDPNLTTINNALLTLT